MELTNRRSSMRLLAIVLALAATAASWALASRAEAAKVANPGAFTATVTEGTIRIKTSTFNFDDSGTPITFNGTVSAAGAVNVPVAGQNFPPFDINAGGYDLTIRIIPTHDLTGTINPMTGAGSLRLRVYIKIDGVPFGGGCAIGTSGSPIDLNVLTTGTTSPPGPNTPISGTPYNTSNGTVKIVNNTYSVPASNSCGPGGGTVDSELGLPSASGNNEAQFTLVTSPILQKGVNASYTVTPNSGFAPLASNFNASASTVAAGVKTCTPALPSTPNCGYRWDWDDDGTVDEVTNTATASHTYLTGGNYTSRVTIYDNDGDSDTTTRTVTVTDRPDLTLDKSHIGNFQTGVQGTYTIGVDNIGAGPTTGTTTVTDTLPAGLTYASASGSGWSCNNSGQDVTCTRTGTIAAGGSAPDITLNVNVADSARGGVTNSASVATPNELATGNNSDSDPTDVDAIDVAIDKSHTGSFRVGRNEPYTLRVTNDGTLPTSGTTTISDTLPTGMNYFSSSAPAGWSCTGSGASFSCTHAGPLAVGYDDTITLTVAVDGTALPARTNTATISTPGDTDSSDDSSSDPTVVVAAPDLQIDKSHNNDFRVGDTGTYELDVSNVGALPTSGTTTVTDTVPAGLPVQSASGSGWSCNVSGQDVTCTNNAVLQPDTALPTITITTDVTQAAMPQVTNSATVATSGTGPDADPNPANDTDADPTNVNATDLTIDKSHSGTFPVGGSGTFTLAVSNPGTAATSGTTTVTDTLPADLSYDSASGAGWSCNASGQDVTCTRANPIAAGASAPTITLNVNVANTVAPDVTNTATVSGADDINGANDSDSDTASLVAADLEITKSHGGDFRVGSNRTYDLKVRNVGPLPTTGTTTVTDELPAGLTYVSASGPNWSCNASGQDVTCTRTNPIPAGGLPSTIQLTVAVGTAAAPSVVNTATVDNSGDRNPANDSSSDPTTVNAVDLAISKSHSGQFRAGGSGSYTIEVDNLGDVATNSVATVTDTLPADLTYTGFTGDDWDCSASGQLVTCEHPAGIPAGGSTDDIDLRVAVAGSAGPSITNTASVAVAGDINSANDSDGDVSGVGRIDLTVTKAVGVDGLSRGDQAAYTIDVENNGDLDTVGATTVTDTLPAGLSYVSASGSGWNCSFASGEVTCVHPAAIGGNSSAPTIDLQVGVSAGAPDPITNTATVATQDDSNAANDSDSTTDPVTGTAPDIALSMTRNGGLRAGGIGSFSLSARNIGTGPTTGPTTIAMTLIGTSFKAGSGSGWSCNVGTATCTHAGPIAAGERSDLEVDVNVSAGASIVITSAAAATTGDSETANNSASDTGGATKIDLAAGISHSGDLAPGQEGSFTVSVKNVGSAATVGTTTLRVPVPGSLNFVSAAGSGWNCTQSGDDAVCSHPGAIAPGATASFELRAKALTAGATSLTATSTTTDDVNAANDAATDSFTVGVGPGPSLVLKKAKLKVPKSGKVKVPATCPSGSAACTGTLTLTIKGKVVGSASYNLRAGTTGTVKVKLDKKTAKKLVKKGKLKVVATAGSSTAKLKLKLKKPKKS